MPVSTDLVRQAVLEDACLAALVVELIGTRTAYAIVPAGAPVYVFESQGPFAKFCRAIRDRDGGASCMACDVEHGAEAGRTRGTLSYMCHAGLLDLAAPIIAGKDHVATVFCGQKRYKEAEAAALSRARAIAVESRLGFPSGQLLALWEQVEAYSDEQVERLASRLSVLSKYVAGSVEREKTSRQLLAATQAIASVHVTTQPRQLYETIVIETASCLDASRCGLAVRRGSEGSWVVQAALDDSWMSIEASAAPECEGALADLEDGRIVGSTAPDSHPFGVLLEVSPHLAALPAPPGPTPRGILLIDLGGPWDAVDAARKGLLQNLLLHAGLSLNNLALREEVGGLSSRAIDFAIASLQRTLATPLAHEVKNGLQRITGAADLLAAMLPSPQGSPAAKLFEQLSTECADVTRLVKSMLDVSKGGADKPPGGDKAGLDRGGASEVETGKLTVKKRWLYLNDIIEETTALAQVVANKEFRAKQIQFTPHLATELAKPRLVTPDRLRQCNASPTGEQPEGLIGKPVFADPDLLKQAIVNLLVNSMKAAYEKMKQPILIATELQRGRGRRPDIDWVTIRVTDYGRGFSREALPRLFDAGYSGTGGTGLGLYLVKVIIEREHGGSVEAESKGEGSGASFTLSIPRTVGRGA